MRKLENEHANINSFDNSVELEEQFTCPSTRVTVKLHIFSIAFSHVENFTKTCLNTVTLPLKKFS